MLHRRLMGGMSPLPLLVVLLHLLVVCGSSSSTSCVASEEELRQRLFEDGDDDDTLDISVCGGSDLELTRNLYITDDKKRRYVRIVCEDTAATNTDGRQVHRRSGQPSTTLQERQEAWNDDHCSIAFNGYRIIIRTTDQILMTAETNLIQHLPNGTMVASAGSVASSSTRSPSTLQVTFSHFLFEKSNFWLSDEWEALIDAQGLGLSLVLQNCNFQFLESFTPVVSVVNASMVSIEQCQFVHNTDHACSGIVSVESVTTVVVAHSTFVNGYVAEGNGGAIAIVDQSLPGSLPVSHIRMENSTFASNLAFDYGGAIFVSAPRADVVWDNVQFQGETTSGVKGRSVFAVANEMTCDLKTFCGLAEQGEDVIVSSAIDRARFWKSGDNMRSWLYGNSISQSCRACSGASAE